MIALEEITPEYIAQLEQEKNEYHLDQLVRESVVELADQYHNIKYQFNLIETNCKIRAMKLVEIGWDLKDIAELFGVRVTTVRRWVK